MVRVAHPVNSIWKPQTSFRTQFGEPVSPKRYWKADGSRGASSEPTPESRCHWSKSTTIFLTSGTQLRTNLRVFGPRLTIDRRRTDDHHPMGGHLRSSDHHPMGGHLQSSGPRQMGGFRRSCDRRCRRGLHGCSCRLRRCGLPKSCLGTSRERRSSGEHCRSFCRLH